MKKNYLIVILIMFVTLCYSATWVPIDGHTTPEKPEITILTSNDNETTMNVEIFGFYIEDIVVKGETYQKISLPDYSTTLNVGKPAVPVISETIGIHDEKKMCL